MYRRGIICLKIDAHTLHIHTRLYTLKNTGMTQTHTATHRAVWGRVWQNDSNNERQQQQQQQTAASTTTTGPPVLSTTNTSLRMVCLLALLLLCCAVPTACYEYVQTVNFCVSRCCSRARRTNQKHIQKNLAAVGVAVGGGDTELSRNNMIGRFGSSLQS